MPLHCHQFRLQVVPHWLWHCTCTWWLESPPQSADNHCCCCCWWQVLVRHYHISVSRGSDLWAVFSRCHWQIQWFTHLFACPTLCLCVCLCVCVACLLTFQSLSPSFSQLFVMPNTIAFFSQTLLVLSTRQEGKFGTSSQCAHTHTHTLDTLLFLLKLINLVFVWLMFSVIF